MRCDKFDNDFIEYPYKQICTHTHTIWISSFDRLVLNGFFAFDWRVFISVISKMLTHEMHRFFLEETFPMVFIICILNFMNGNNWWKQKMKTKIYFDGLSKIRTYISRLHWFDSHIRSFALALVFMHTLVPLHRSLWSTLCCLCCFSNFLLNPMLNVSHYAWMTVQLKFTTLYSPERFSFCLFHSRTHTHTHYACSYLIIVRSYEKKKHILLS